MIAWRAHASSVPCTSSRSPCHLAGRNSAATLFVDRVGVFVATCGYLGYVAVAPGTFGSAAGLAVFFAVRGTGSTGVELATIVVLFAIGIWSGTVAEHHFGGIDPGPVVIDEVVGMLITLALLAGERSPAPSSGSSSSACSTSSSRGRRRGFEKLPGGLGVMADDGMAAMYGNLVMRGLIWLAPAGWLRVKPLGARGDRRRRQRAADAAAHRHQLALHHRAAQPARHRRRAQGASSATIATSWRTCSARRSARADLVVFSGGLGPTDDDVTREVVAAVLGRALDEDAAITEQMRARFAARGYHDADAGDQPPAGDGARRRARHREHARQRAGPVARGGRRVVLLLPGPPRELKPMLTALVDGPLRARASGGVARAAGHQDHRTDRVADRRGAAAALSGVGDAHAADRARRSSPRSARSSCTCRRAPRRGRGRPRSLDAAVRQVCAVLGADVVQHRRAVAGGRSSAICCATRGCASPSPSRAPAG